MTEEDRLIVGASLATLAALIFLWMASGATWAL